MEETPRKKNVISLYIYTLLLFISLSALVRFDPLKKSVLSESVSINAEVPLYLTIRTRPQNRIPHTGNDSLEQVFEIRTEGTTTALVTETATSNNDGDAELTPISGSVIPSGSYDVAIKGLSHLRRVFHSVPIGTTAIQFVDLTDPILLAGDSYPLGDNYVNSLDLSYTVRNLYLTDLRADLNRDGIVNSLEFPTQISNLYSYGDD